MNLSGLVVQFVNGLAGASSLFFVAAGLSLIFGVSRIVNFAHGSFYMVGIYLAYSFVEGFRGVLGFWPALLLAPLATGLLGAVVEVLLLRRLYRAPELLQLLATFALMLVLRDAVLWWWGPEELLGPRAPGLGGAVQILGRAFPTYDLFLIVAGPAVLGLLWLLLHRTRWGTLLRAATQDREMASALGVNQAWLFTGVFALGALLAGLGGALQLPREPATLEMDLNVIGAAFVVVVVGGMGSIPGAFLAALLLAQCKAVFIWLGTVELWGVPVAFSRMTLVVDFVVMAAVLLWRPWGLLGRPQPPSRPTATRDQPLQGAGPAGRRAALLLLLALAALPLAAGAMPYAMVLATDLLVAALFAASLHFIIGPAGMTSFGHAAYFGLGAYGAALLLRAGALPMELALLLGPLAAALGAAVFGGLAVRLSGVYLAMLTLAFAQITWALVYQWDGFTGGSNGLTGIWPAPWLADKRAYYALTLAVTVAGLLWMRRMLFSPFGLALRALRDAPLRAESIGLDAWRLQWAAFVVAGSLAGVAGALYAFSKGSISTESLGVGKSVDGLVMVLLGGVQTLAGPVVGAFTFGWLQDTVARHTDYWRATLGATILLLVLLLPRGIAGSAQQLFRYWQARRGATATADSDAAASAATQPGGGGGEGRGGGGGDGSAAPFDTGEDDSPRGVVGDATAPAIPNVLHTRQPVGTSGTSFAGPTPASTPSLLQVRGLGKSFGGVRAVDGIAIDLAAGELLALIGPNGAGKSTTFNMLHGQLAADSGSILLDGTSLAGLPPRAIWRLGVGRTFQIAETFGSLRVIENVQMALLSQDGLQFAPWRRAAPHRRAEALALLQQVGVARQAERPCADLAYGDLKRVELAVALAHAPRLLLMDEPTAGMAPAERAALMQLVRQLARQRAMGVLFTEHAMDTVFANADRVLVLSRGRIVAQGSPQDIRADAEVQRIYLGTGAAAGASTGATL